MLLLDEPTRGIDVGAKAEIYALIRELAAQGKAVIMTSSELPELLAVSDRIIVLCEGRLTAEIRRRSGHRGSHHARGDGVSRSEQGGGRQRVMMMHPWDRNVGRKRREANHQFAIHCRERLWIAGAAIFSATSLGDTHWYGCPGTGPPASYARYGRPSEGEFG